MKNMQKKAQSLIEYGLILALVAIIAITVLSKFGQTITNVGNKTDSDVSTASEQASNNYCASIGLTYENGICVEN